jgi:hypothetical protein
MAAKLG